MVTRIELFHSYLVWKNIRKISMNRTGMAFLMRRIRTWWVDDCSPFCSLMYRCGPAKKLTRSTVLLFYSNDITSNDSNTTLGAQDLSDDVLASQGISCVAGKSCCSNLSLNSLKQIDREKGRGSLCPYVHLIDQKGEITVWSQSVVRPKLTIYLTLFCSFHFSSWLLPGVDDYVNYYDTEYKYDDRRNNNDPYDTRNERFDNGRDALCRARGWVTVTARILSLMQRDDCYQFNSFYKSNPLISCVWTYRLIKIW